MLPSPCVLLPRLLLPFFIVCLASGELSLRQPPRPPRVYGAAPPGVEVTSLRAFQRFQGIHRPAHEPHFSLHRSDKTDHNYFNIDEQHGNITTARHVERLVGYEYRVMVVVLASGRAIYKDLRILVTEYNKYAPEFNLPEYSAEVVSRAGIGTTLLTVTASDRDPVTYNREIHYFLADPDVPFHLDPFLDPLEWSPVRVDPRTGVVRVVRSLQHTRSPLHLLVGAVDGGSPQRHTLANLTIYIRDMPAPRSVFVTNTSENSMTVCWSPPSLGHPDGYILTYIPIHHFNNIGQGHLNLTTEQLHTKFSTWGGDEEIHVNGDGMVHVYRYCAVVGGLMPRTQYLVSLQAWASTEISVSSIPIQAATMSDYCAQGVCEVGNCSLQQDPPGYSCTCPPSYYGSHCEAHNPCLPHNPCHHLGQCINNTDGSYTCECLQGFYGQNCALMDPCTAVPSNPCTNGGSCLRSSKLPRNPAGLRSDQYECVCPEGYYGITCEHRDPCLPNPCQNGASCNNLSHTSFSCLCPPGYTGKVCDEDINECDSNPCMRGECTNKFNDYHCRCPQGWGGKNCEEDLDECASSPCFNGATCIDGHDSYVCDCAHGYSGIRCGIKVSALPPTVALHSLRSSTIFPAPGFLLPA